MASMLRERERRLAGIAAVKRDDDAPETVWAVVGPGRKRRVRREVAEAEGWPIDKSKPKSGGIPASNTYRLPPGERDKIALQTGYRPDDYADYKRYKRENKLRDQEPGERAFDQKVAIAEWVRGGARPEDKPVGNCSIQPRDRPRESLQQWKERARRRGDRW